MEGIYQRLRLELMGIYLGLYSGMVSFLNVCLGVLPGSPWVCEDFLGHHVMAIHLSCHPEMVEIYLRRVWRWVGVELRLTRGFIQGWWGFIQSGFFRWKHSYTMSVYNEAQRVA